MIIQTNFCSIFTEIGTALRTGNPAAVFWIFKSLALYTKRETFSVEQLKGQLEIEYGISLEDATEELVPVTAEEKAIVERSGKVRAEDHDWIL
jgi:hypothetical protein